MIEPESENEKPAGPLTQSHWRQLHPKQVDEEPGSADVPVGIRGSDFVSKGSALAINKSDTNGT